MMNKEENLVSEINPKRGEIWLGKFDKIKEFSKDFRPVLIISNNLQNEFDDKIIIVPITTEDLDIISPFEVYLEKNKEFGLDENSKILLSYPSTIQKNLMLKYKLGSVNEDILNKVKMAWEIALRW